MTSRILLAGIVSVGICWSSAGWSQSCDTPLPIYVNAQVSGSSCGTDHLPQLNVGATRTPGDDVVYRLYVGEDGADSAALTSDESLGLFLCRAPCGTSSECVAAGSTGVNTTVQIPIPHDDGDYFLIVDSRESNCGDFTLNVSGPLGQMGGK